MHWESSETMWLQKAAFKEVTLDLPALFTSGYELGSQGEERIGFGGYMVD